MSVAISLPEFDAPPLEEVALAVQVAPLVGVRATDLATIRQAFVDEYPRLEEHPPSPPMSLQSSPIEVRVGPMALQPRLWFVSSDETRLVQFQADRLVVNWRRMRVSAPYPRYEHAVRPAFVDAWKRLCAGLSALGHAEPLAEIVEATYVNHIPYAALAEVLAPWSGELSEPTAAAPPDVAVTMAWDEFAGAQVQAQVHRGIRIDDGEMRWIVTLTGRNSLGADTSLDGALAMLDQCRAAAVRGFAAITTKEMHQLWLRTS